MPHFTIETIDALTRQAVFGRKRKASGRRGIAVSSHPLVTRCATDVLRDGGNAVDAVLAAAVAQTVVEPHMSTLFGVFGMLHHDVARRETIYLNGSMNAPLAGLPGFSAADLSGGRGVAVPGFWAAWEAAHGRFGSLPRERLLAPAIELARLGLPIYPFLYGMMFEQAHKIGITAEGREIYFRDNTLRGPGERLVQTCLARTLEQLAAHGHDHFYRSSFTQRVVNVVREAGGVLTMEDFDRYEVRWMEPAWGTYRGRRIAGSPPPDTGGTHLIEILNLIELIPLSEWGPPTTSADTMYWLARFCNEVFAEGARLRDPAVFPVPLQTIVSKEYARNRFELMKTSLPTRLRTEEVPYPGSNHLTVVDAQGNVATVLHSVMSSPWSNGLIVDGVNLWAGASHFLRQMPPPGGRGTCYVAPHIIFAETGKPEIAAGSPGIGLIPNCVQNALNLIDFGLDIEASVHRPRIGGPSLATLLLGPSSIAHMLEVDCGDEVIHAEVRKRGLALDLTSPWHFHVGSYEGVHMRGNGLAEACADPRRTGAAEAV